MPFIVRSAGGAANGISSGAVSGAAPFSVDFTSWPVGGPVGTTFAYAWDFGDGNTSTAQNPTHVYAAGSYTASLVVTFSDNMSTAYSCPWGIAATGPSNFWTGFVGSSEA